jgi:hypothetical protein
MKEDVKSAVKEAITEVLGDFTVDRQTHYKHHQAIGSFIDWFEKFKGHVCGSLAKTLVTVFLLALLVGFGLLAKGVVFK